MKTTTTRVRPRATLTALMIAVTALLAMPATAWGHAQLIGSTPGRGETVPTTPALIELEFNEPVEASFGALRLHDSEGRALETGPIERPGGRREVVAIRPPAELEEGAYTLTFRIVSADSHPVAGGFIFSVGESEAPTLAVADLLAEEGGSGRVTEILFAASRVLAYAALAAMLGGLAFLFFVWRPVRAPGERGAVLPATLRRLMMFGGLTLALAAAAGIVFQGALAAGIAIPDALDGDVLGEVLDTRYGETALLRGVAALAFAALVALPWHRRAAVPPSALAMPLLALGLAAAASLGLGGHAGAASELWLTAPASLGHVLAMAAWFGGLGILLWLVPRTTRRLEQAGRSALLAQLVGRFSLLAIAAVAVLLFTGVIQSVVHLAEVAELWESGFGRAILIKIVLFAGLISFGWYNRQRLRPRLAAAAAEGAAPGRAGSALRTALRAEIALALGVLAASSILVSLAPASSTDAIFTDSASSGPIEIEIVFEPARVDSQEVHVYLFDGETGSQWDEIEEIRLSASEPEQDIGPLPIELQRAGPGHYLSGGHLIAVPGRWTLDLDIRVSEFDSYGASFDLRVR